jgi:hypothetical protein
MVRVSSADGRLGAHRTNQFVGRSLLALALLRFMQWRFGSDGDARDFQEQPQSTHWKPLNPFC